MAKRADTEFNGQVMKAFGVALRAARFAAGFRHAKTFAQQIGISEWRYRAWERGEYTPNLMTLTRMCRLLKVRPDELMPFAVSDDVPLPRLARGGSSSHTRKKAA